MNEKNITDTVMKWKEPQAAQNKSNPQLQKINSMKDSALAALKPELNEMQQLLKSYVDNFLQEKPSAGAHKQLDKKMEKKLNHVYEQITKLLWNVMASLSPEQKQAIRNSINQSPDKNDFFKAFPGAFNAVMEGKKSAP